MNNVFKSLNIKGNLNSSNPALSINLINCNFRKGLWYMCIKDIAYENKSRTSFSQFAQVKCNLVKDLRYFERCTQSYLPSLQTILFKASSLEKKITYFEFNWFQINNPEDILKLTFVDPKSENRIEINCEVFVTVLLKQM